MNDINYYINQIKNNEELENYLSIECDVDFVSHEILEDDLNALMENGKCNYKLTPFACDGEGGVYVILDNNKIGYLDSEGQAGIIANNIKDFFSIIIHCGYIDDYGKFNCLKDLESFLSYYNERTIPREKRVIKNFIKQNSLENHSDQIYKLFKEAILSEPKLVIESTDEDNDDSTQIFNI